MLNGLEGKTSVLRVTSNGFAIVTTTHCVGSIFDNRNPRIGGNCIYPVHIANHSRIVHDYDSLGSRRNFLTDALRGNQARCRVDIGPNHFGSDQFDSHIGRFGCQCGADHFVVGTYPCEHQRNMQCGSTRIK